MQQMEQTPQTLRITSGGKVQAYVASALEALAAGAQLQLEAKGAAVCKAVTVAELTKRRLRGVHQITQIGLADPDGEASVPTIAIALSQHALDSTQPGCPAALLALSFGCGGLTGCG